jgi:hypothetical protein
LSRLSIAIGYAGANRRTITFAAVGERYASLIERLRSRSGNRSA